MSLTEIERAVSDLSEDERGSLAAHLLDSLPPHGHGDGAAEGIEEAARRRNELDTGKVRPLNSDEFWVFIQRGRAG